MSSVTAQIVNHTPEGAVGLDVLLCNTVYKPTPHSALSSVHINIHTHTHIHTNINWHVHNGA